MYFCLYTTHCLVTMCVFYVIMYKKKAIKFLFNIKNREFFK